MPSVQASSKFLKADDLGGRKVAVTISHVAVEPVGKDKEEKFVLYFQGKKKGMVLNTTNINTLRGAYGPCTTEAQEWRGRPVILYSAMVSFAGQTMPGLRIEIPAGGAQQPQPARHIQPAVQEPAEELPGDFVDDGASEAF